MKKIAIMTSLALFAGMLTGCAGTPVVYYTECDCPQNGQTATEAPAAEAETEAPAATEAVTEAAEAATEAQSAAQEAAEGEVKTGLVIAADTTGSANAADDKATKADFNVTMVAVTVDAEGVIESCIIDGIASTVEIDAAGAFVTDVTAPISTKNELGDSYGMKAYGGAKYEWYEQAQALADFAVGKTVEELKNGAVDETGKAPAGTDLASTATIYLGGYVSAIEAAVNNAQYLGAQSGDTLRMAANISTGSSTAAAGEEAGLVQLDADVTALTEKDGVITSCQIDSLQAKINFDAAGTLTSELTNHVQTKNELGEAYGMKAYAGSAYEWNEQAAALAQYVTGKTAEEVAGIAVSETTAPTEADLASTVTIAIGGYQALIAKALQ